MSRITSERRHGDSLSRHHSSEGGKCLPSETCWPSGQGRCEARCACPGTGPGWRPHPEVHVEKPAPPQGWPPTLSPHPQRFRGCSGTGANGCLSVGSGGPAGPGPTRLQGDVSTQLGPGPGPGRGAPASPYLPRGVPAALLGPLRGGRRRRCAGRQGRPPAMAGSGPPGVGNHGNFQNVPPPPSSAAPGPAMTAALSQ